MSTILVTGGAGFIGSNLCEVLLKLGNKVIIIDSFNDFYNPAYKRQNVYAIKDSLQVYECDIRDIAQIEKIFASNSIDLIVHLAAYAGVRPSILNSSLYTDVNINGTINILECMKKYEIKKLIFASSSSVYGNSSVPFSENDSVNKPISPYAATKKSGELLCYTYHHLYKFSIACLRFFTVYGPRQRPDLAIYKFTKNLFDHNAITLYGDGSTSRDYTYIDDIIDGILKAIGWVSNSSNQYDIFNLGESNTISLIEMVRVIEEATGCKAELTVLPIQEGDVISTWADISKAKRILGYNPKTDFRTGIGNFIKWYKENRLEF